MGKARKKKDSSRFSSWHGSVGSTHSSEAIERVIESPIETKLIDFDTVVDANQIGSPRLSKVIVGTDGYIPPEAYKGKYSAASDIYSAGVIMFKLLTREYPWDKSFFDDVPGENWVGSPSMNRIADRLANTKIDFNLPALVCNEAARDLLEQILDPEPHKRPSAEEVLSHRWFDIKGGESH